MFKLLNEEGLWQTLLRQKYLRNQNLAQVQRQPTNYTFGGRGPMKVKEDFFSFGTF
jgi:hypothetical protein